MKKYLVNVPVADLRREPVPAKELYDPHQETQLLYNERLIGLEVNNGWLYVEALEQLKSFEGGRWHGYPGWISASQVIEVEQFPVTNLTVISPWAQITSQISVSFGTRLVGVEELADTWRLKLADGSEGFILKNAVKGERSPLWREAIVERGKAFLGAPYFWGGRSAYREDLQRPFTSVDCSGLVQLLYRSEGFNLPRDAHDQFLYCRRQEGRDMQAGDLLFQAPVRRSRITHVMIYIGNDELLEAEMAAGKVRVVSLKNKFGTTMKEMPWGYNNGEHLIYGSSLTEK